MSAKSKVRREAMRRMPEQPIVCCPNCHRMSVGHTRRLISPSSRLRYIKYFWGCCRGVQTVDRLTGEESWGRS